MFRKSWTLVCACILTASLISADTVRTVSAPVWVFMELMPGTEQKREIPPMRELEVLGRYIIGGMIFGWQFSYTPPDAARKVEEFFELIPIQSIPEHDSKFTLSDIAADYPRLNSWARYSLDENDARWQDRWSSSAYQSATGTGKGERTDETKGIFSAYRTALLNAVRERARKQEKNKPKEIRGEMLLRENPRVFTEGGFFVAEIRVRILISEIVPYRMF